MTTGSGLYISQAEKDPFKQNTAIRQLIEGRSNAVGTVTLNGNGVATSTVVTARTCSSSSAVFLFPATAHAAAVVATTYVTAPNVVAGQFTVTHAATANGDATFWWVCLG
jgi:hypothetical protein